MIAVFSVHAFTTHIGDQHTSLKSLIMDDTHNGTFMKLLLLGFVSFSAELETRMVVLETMRRATD